MSSFDDHELENKLYKQIADYFAPAPPHNLARADVGGRDYDDDIPL
jgi:hypothetical protein